MTQNEKELILKDVCARLPYNVMVHGVCANQNFDFDTESDYIEYTEFDNVLTLLDIEWVQMCVSEVKPYLFPMSSMTEEQKQEYTYIVNYINSDDTNNWKEGEFIYIDQFTQLMHFYHKHHIDYRGLISMGLAIDATNLNIY